MENSQHEPGRSSVSLRERRADDGPDDPGCCIVRHDSDMVHSRPYLLPRCHRDGHDPQPSHPLLVGDQQVELLSPSLRPQRGGDRVHELLPCNIMLAPHSWSMLACCQDFCRHPHCRSFVGHPLPYHHHPLQLGSARGHAAGCRIAGRGAITDDGHSPPASRGFQPNHHGEHELWEELVSRGPVASSPSSVPARDPLLLSFPSLYTTARKPLGSISLSSFSSTLSLCRSRWTPEPLPRA
mmetsp:Transcript_7306/g.25125  ORF Transcript_7306/g.25125 Transcript_7306/m.25125 type:complete len:239 (+) Transcript_7306:972-1688(+)